MRAWYRLLLFVTVTVAHAVALAARTGGKVDTGAGREQARRWARALLSCLDIEVTADAPLTPFGSLYVANHRSYLDIPVLLAFAPVTFLAKSEVGAWPVLGWAARCAGTLFVRRDQRASRAAARDAIRAHLMAGHSVAVFPEGTTTAGPGLGPLRPGSFEVAAGRAPVVPVAIRYEHVDDAWIGDDEFLPHFLRRFQVRRRRVALCFGPPLYDADPERLRQRAAAWIHSALAAGMRER